MPLHRRVDRELLAALTRRHLLISIAAGKSLARLQALAGGRARVVRVMPNLNVSVGAGMSVFTPELTNAVSAVAEGYAKEKSAFKFQRKLMPGGVCEASAFSAYGIHSTCVCLPLGNYHNMAGVEAVEAGARSARPGREFVSVADYHGMIELLGAIARRLDAPGHSRLASMEKIWAERGPLLDGAK